MNSERTIGEGVRRFVILALHLAAFAVLVKFALDGWSYYETPLIERPRHPGYWDFKPGGTRGSAYGIVGAGLMVVMLVYSLRKRWKPLRKLGKLRSWLDFHIFCGLIGPSLIVLHTSFKFRGLVAISFWSMVAVMLSGVLGRYLYLQIPRRRSGDELSLDEARARAEELSAVLREEHGLSDEDLAALDAMAHDAREQKTPLAVLLFRLPFDGLLLRWKVRRFLARAGMVRGASRHRAGAAIRDRVLLERRVWLWDRLQRLFHYWHVFHKPFAIVMYLFMVIHIAVAVGTGYAWQFG